jgi:hypothetical protein
MNPLVEERMLGNFNAKNTKERAAAPKKKVHLSCFSVIPFPMFSLSHCSSFLTVLPAFATASALNPLPAWQPERCY